jgi:hypothetical protein
MFTHNITGLEFYTKSEDIVSGEVKNESFIINNSGAAEIFQTRTNKLNNLFIKRNLSLNYDSIDDVGVLTSNLNTTYIPIPKYVSGEYFLTTTDDYGKLISRTTTQLLAIVDPEVGRLYYNTTINDVVFYNGTGWKKLSHSNM